MLTEEQLRNGLINPASRWPNRVVPFVIDDVFSEHCSTKLQNGKQGVEGIIHVLRVPAEIQYTLGWGGSSNGDRYISLPIKTHTHTHPHIC